MLQALPLYGKCPECDGAQVSEPVVFEDDMWVTCFDCAHPVMSWVTYKALAIARGSEGLQRKVRSGRPSRRSLRN